MGQGRDKVDGNTKRRPWTPVTKMEDFAYYANRFITGTHHGGPFNKVLYDKEYPKDSEEYIYREHDIAYGKYGNKGYFYFNKADQDLLDKLPRGGRNEIARAYFKLKKAVAPSMGEEEPPNKKRKYNNMGDRMDLSEDRYGANWTRSPAPRTGREGMRAGAMPPPMVGAGSAIQRYKASKLSTQTRTRGRSAAKFKVVPYNPLRMAVDEMRKINPWVEWKMMKTTVTPIQSSTGLQNPQSSIIAGGAYSMMLRTDLKAIYNKLYTDILRTETTVEPNITAIGPSYYGMPHFRCHGWRRTMHLFNPKTTVSYIELYEFVRKNEDGDMTMDPLQYWELELDRATAADAGNYGLAEARLNSQVPTLDAQRLVTDPGERPENIPRIKTSRFWKTWGLLKKTRIRLEPTAKYDHVINIPGFSITHDELYSTTDTAQVIPGISIIMMPISIGERCYDNTAGNQRQSYMPTQTTVWYEDECKFSILKRDQHKYHFVTTVPAEFANAAPSITFVAAAPTVATPSYAQVIPDTPQAEVEG